MKRILLTLIFFGATGIYSAQDVITFLEDFQNTDVDVLENAVANPALAAPGDLVNYNSDSLPTTVGNSGAFYTIDDLLYATPHGPIEIFNYVARSDSWLVDFLPGNRNYLILPELEITEEAHFFSWKSGVRQAPSFMDGYSVGIVTDMTNVEDSYTPLWSAAQFVIDDNTWHPAMYGPDYDFTDCTADSGPVVSQDFSEICYFPEAGDGLNGTGYVHANGLTDITYLGLAGGDEAQTSYIGLLEPHEISLANYIGQTVRLALRHDSDDDFFLTIDDLMVSSGLPVGVNEIEFSRFISMYPNPVADQLRFNFTEEVKDNAVINVLDMKGSILFSEVISQGALNGIYTVDMSKLSAGLYNVSVTIDNKETVSSKILKQ